MSNQNAMNYLSDAIDKAIDYCRDEFEMSYAEAVGVLEIKTAYLIQEAMEHGQEEQD
jgi:hypothetical protein